MTGSCGAAATSNAANLTVETESPAITSHPSSQTLCAGENAAFSVTASGPGLAYRWQVDDGGGFTDLADGGVYAGVSTATMTITGAAAGMDGFLYRCAVTGTCPPPATSDAATLTVHSNPVPSISGPTANTCPVQDVTLTTEAGMSAYQWFRGTDAIAGATLSSCTAQASGSYSVTYTDGNGCTGTSAPHAVTIVFCETTEVSPHGSPVPARLVHEGGSYYLHFEKISSATGYNIYQGTIGSYYSHGSTPGSGFICDATATDLGTGEMRAAILPSDAGRYYLVTAFGSGVEGVSGYASSGAEIPASQSTCPP